MNLIIDVGNSKVKLAVFNNNKLMQKVIIDVKDATKSITKLTEKYSSIQYAIISSVGDFNLNEIKSILKKIDVLELDHNTNLPFINCYKTPKTLGVDRIALVSAAVKSYPKKNVLVIDAGTCITYDFISADTKYLGGSISPGLNLRYKSLNTLTANLPLLEPKAPKQLIGQDTNMSIHSGVVNGILREIDGTIEEYLKKYELLTVILTGGDTKFLSKRLKNTIFANSNFLLEGLNYILEFNKS